MIITYFLLDISDCGGIQQTTCLMINSLLKIRPDYKITTVSLKHKYDKTFFEINSEVANYALFDRPVNTRWEKSNIRQRLTELLNKIVPDILIVQGTAYTLFVPKTICKTCKVIVCEHGHYKMGKIFGLHWWGTRKALKYADAIITLTDLDANNFKQKDKRGIVIKRIYNPICFFKQNHLYDSSSKTIVCCGTLSTLKRFDHAILAAKIVKESYPDWKWVIYGDGSERTSLQKLINNNSLQDNVALKGYEKDKSVIYDGKALLVLTSKFEGFGMVLIEAMQYGIPIVSYDVPYGPKEIIQNDLNGKLVKNGNVTALAEAIKVLITNIDVRTQMSNNCLLLLGKFSIDRITEEWIELFEQI